MEKTLANVAVAVNDEGFLTDFSQWSKEVGAAIAAEEGVTMTPKHWEVIEYLQDQQKKGEAISVRKVGKSGVVSIKEFYELFPNAPLKTSTKIAGIPKPVSCI